MEPMSDPGELRKLAAWYRQLSERTENPAIWEMRLTAAERLEAEADRVERHLPPAAQGTGIHFSRYFNDLP
jgi:hypothetical protein